MEKITKEQKQQWKEIHKQYLHEHGKDRIKYNNVGDPDFAYKSFVIFDDTVVSQGGWSDGKWMTAKFMNKAQKRWVDHSYETRLDELYKKGKLDIDITNIENFDKTLLDYTHGTGQCGGCRFFAALDADYGICCNELSTNDGRVTFEHGGCIQHSFLQELLNENV